MEALLWIFIGIMAFGVILFLTSALATLFVISKPLDAFDVDINDSKDGKK